MNKIYLICGVPGSGKTWTLTKLARSLDPTTTIDEKTFNNAPKLTHVTIKHITFIHYDSHFNTSRQDYAIKIINSAKESIVIADCPLGVSEIIQAVKAQGCPIQALFVIEDPKVVESRYIAREGKPIPKQHLSRIKTMVQRAKEYNGFSGTSKEVYEYLLTQLQ